MTKLEVARVSGPHPDGLAHWGSTVVFCGRPPENAKAGWFFEPTIVTDVARESDPASQKRGSTA